MKDRYTWWICEFYKLSKGDISLGVNFTTDDRHYHSGKVRESYFHMNLIKFSLSIGFRIKTK